MGLLKSSIYFTPLSTSFIPVSLFDSESRFFAPTHTKQRQPEPPQWLPDATRQLAICAPELRLLFCGFCPPQFESDTTGLMHCPSERAKNAKPTESSRGVLVRCPPWQALSPAVCCRSRRVRQ